MIYSSQAFPNKILFIANTVKDFLPPLTTHFLLDYFARGISKNMPVLKRIDCVAYK